MHTLRSTLCTASAIALTLLASQSANAQRRPQQQPPQQQDQSQDPMVHFSVMGNVGLPIGDLASASDIGVGVAIRAEGPLSTPGMSLRGGLSWDRFNGKGPIDSYTFLGASGELVHRDRRSPLYEFAGLGLYGSKVNFETGPSEDHTNLGMQAGLGFDLNAGGPQTTFIEFGVQSIFTSGGSSVWFPMRIGIRF